MHSRQKKDAPLMQEHPPWNSVLRHMHSLHTHKFHNALILRRDIRLCSVGA